MNCRASIQQYSICQEGHTDDTATRLDIVPAPSTALLATAVEATMVAMVALLSNAGVTAMAAGYRLVWAKKVTIAAICLDISSTSFGIQIN
jgi:hypothetical protein